DPDRDVRVDRQPPIDRIDRETDLDAPVIGDATGGEPIGVMLTGDDERAFSFGRAGQRAQLAPEFQLVEPEPRVARGIHKYGTSVIDDEPIDRDAVQIEAELGNGP